MALKYDVVWFWDPAGKEWRDGRPGFGEGIEAVVGRLTREGYVAHRGLLSIGPPEGAPGEAELHEAAALARHGAAFAPCRLCRAMTRYRDPRGEPLCGGH